MKIRAIEMDELDQATELLQEGFGSISKEHMKKRLLKMFHYANQFGHSQIGYIASNNDGDIGITLALPFTRSIYEQEPINTVNFAAFYIKPKFTWMASLFLRKVMTQKDIDYVDVTASASMRKINQHLGFVNSATGLLVIPLAASAIRPFRMAKIRTFNLKKTCPFSVEITKILEDHIDLGCHVLTIERDDEIFPVVLRPKKRGHMPTARVILAKDRDLILHSLGSLSRYLLAQGFFFLEMDVFEKPDLWETSFRKRSAPIQSTKPKNTIAIDHTYTELVY